MRRDNHTVDEFILAGFTTDAELQLILFGVFLCVYSVTIARNTTIITLICNDSRLHMPVYFFIGNLSLLDLWYSSVYTPKILVTCISEDKNISLAACIAQFFFSAGLGYTECYLLASKAYDDFQPFALCSSHVREIVHLFSHIFLYWRLRQCSNTKQQYIHIGFCGDNVIDDIFCDVPPLVKLACYVRESYQAMLFFLMDSNVIAPILLIFIIASILRNFSTQGHLKAFSTCSSHLISVILYYSSILYIFFSSRSIYSLEWDKLVSTCYTVVFTMLNPMIYSLRDKDMKEALKKLFK